jgi:hypothetical protein
MNVIVATRRFPTESELDVRGTPFGMMPKRAVQEGFIRLDSMADANASLYLKVQKWSSTDA